MEPGSDFSALMQQAAALKTEQVKQERRVFESKPTFLQNTLFHCRDEAVREARAKQDPVDRIEAARAFKEQGNNLFKQQAYFDANDKYEKCIGCFWYIATTETDWKSKGVKDEHLSYRYEGVSEDEQVRALVVSALLNIAACHTKLCNWAMCIATCDAALGIDPDNAKALYRRAQARTLPVSCGAAELDLALKDLRRALKTSPNDKMLRSRFEELRAVRQRQRELDKETFMGMFERGELDPDKENGAPEASEGKGKRERERAEQEQAKLKEQTVFYRDMAHQLRAKGRAGDAAQVERVVEETERKLQAKAFLETADFANPTPEMIRDAKENHGLDLTDPTVQTELQRLTEARARGELDEVDDGPVGDGQQRPAPGSTSGSSANLVFGAALFAAVSVAFSWWQQAV